MAWPTVAVVTTGMDADADNLPRTAILDLATKFNDAIAARAAASGVCELDASALVPVSRIPTSIARATLPTLSKSGDYTAVAADIAYLIDFTTGTFTLALAPAATLGAGWFCYVRNSGTGIISINPDASELVDGVVTTNLRTGNSCLLICTGTAFKTVGYDINSTDTGDSPGNRCVMRVLTGTCNSLATIAGTSLGYFYATAAGGLANGTTATGTWRNTSGINLANNEWGEFQRIA